MSRVLRIRLLLIVKVVVLFLITILLSLPLPVSLESQRVFDHLATHKEKHHSRKEKNMVMVVKYQGCDRYRRDESRRSDTIGLKRPRKQQKILHCHLHVHPTQRQPPKLPSSFPLTLEAGDPCCAMPFRTNLIPHKQSSTKPDRVVSGSSGALCCDKTHLPKKLG